MKQYKDAGELVRQISTPGFQGGEATYDLKWNDGLVFEVWSGGGFSDTTELGEAKTLKDVFGKFFDPDRHTCVRVRLWDDPSFRYFAVLFYPDGTTQEIGYYGTNNLVIEAMRAGASQEEIASLM